MLKTKNFYLKNRLLINCFILAVLFFVNCFWAQAIYVVYPILFVMALVDNLKNGFSYLVFCLPYCLLNPYMSVTLYFVCILAFILKACIIFFVKDKLKINKAVIILNIIFAIYCIVPFGNYDKNVLIKLCFFIFLFALIFFVGKKPEVFRIEFNSHLLALSLMVACLFSVTYFFSPYMSPLLAGSIGQNTRYQALFDNPNVLAMTCEILLPIILYFVMARKSKWYELVLAASVAVIGCLTYSKTFYIILAFILVFLFLWKLRTSTKKTLIISAVVVSCVGVLALFKPQFFIRMWNRFFGYWNNCKSFADFMNMITTYRYDLWIEYIVYMFTNSPFHLIFGYGLGADALTTFSAHNAYLSMFYQLGIVGSILFVAVLIAIFRSLKKDGFKPHKAVWLPILVVMLVLFVEDALFYIIF